MNGKANFTNHPLPSWKASSPVLFPSPNTSVHVLTSGEFIVKTVVEEMELWVCGLFAYGTNQYPEREGQDV